MENKKRAKNFSCDEVKILLELVKEKRDILGSKKSDSISNREKYDSWKEIERRFNLLSGETFRNFKILRGKYENLKKTFKKKSLEEKHEENYIDSDGLNKSVTLTDPPEGIFTVSQAVAEGLPDLTVTEAETEEPVESEAIVHDEAVVHDEAIVVNSDDCDINSCVEVVYLNSFDKSGRVEESKSVSTNKLIKEAFTAVNTPAVDRGQMKNLKGRPISSLSKVLGKKNKNVRNFDRIAARQNINLSSAKYELIKIQKQIFEQQLIFNSQEHALKIEEHKLKIESLKLDMKLKQIEIEVKEKSLIDKL